MTGDSWYFAYGSNMFRDQKIHRTGAIRQGDEGPRVATLKGYRLAFNKRGGNRKVFANIVPCDGDQVMGVIYRWCEMARTIMREEYEVGYVERNVNVMTEADETLEAVTFVASQGCVVEESSPSSDYLSKIIDGARQHGLPEKYIRRIEQFARGREVSNE